MMPSTSSSKTPSKRKRASAIASAAAKKNRAAKPRALRAVKIDPVLTQELKVAHVPTKIGNTGPAHLLPGLELLGLISRTVATSLTLPLAMMRCRTPFEMWGEQTRFFQRAAGDIQIVTARMMTNAFNAVPEQAPGTKGRKRRQA